MPCTRGYDQLFAEKQSGKHGTARPEFTRALVALRPGDTLVFWKSDRWGRSAAHVLTTIGELRGRGVTVKSLTENFDLDTKEGRFMFAVLAAAAEYEPGSLPSRARPATPTHNWAVQALPRSAPW
jgi:DNA invertase Pin-like site-specific DNA recombinase